MNTDNNSIETTSTDVETTSPEKKSKYGLTAQIFIAMVSGALIGMCIKFLTGPTVAAFLTQMMPKAGEYHLYFVQFVTVYLIEGLLEFGTTIFLNILKMLVVPIVFISLVCGTCSMDSSRRFGRLAAKTLIFYATTTMLAIALAISLATLFNVGASDIEMPATSLEVQQIPSLKETLVNMFPSNPIAALAAGNMIQIIVFAILLGIAITWAKERGQRIRNFFQDFDDVIIQLMHIALKLAPYGIFCLITKLFAQLGYEIFVQLAGYFFVLLFILLLQLFVVYSSILYFLGGLSPVPFFKKMASALLFAFSTSSSSASIPVVLDAVENKLGVKESIAAFVIPLGATINMAGTAMMQGVATVFIANSYGIDIGWVGYLQVILTATIASIGTAGIPAVGMITLTMVLIQVGLPVEGVMLIISVDRLLDMTRTAVNTAGDAIIACVVARGEDAISVDHYYDMSISDQIGGDSVKDRHS